MSEIKPVRLRLSRARGFRLQAHSLAVNGLPAVKVDRSTRWGNSFVVGEDGDAERCVQLFVARDIPCLDVMPLRGKNLACWCKEGALFCHADALLEIANRPAARLVSSRSLFEEPRPCG